MIQAIWPDGRAVEHGFRYALDHSVTTFHVVLENDVQYFNVRDHLQTRYKVPFMRLEHGVWIITIAAMVGVGPDDVRHLLRQFGVKSVEVVGRKDIARFQYR